MHYYWQNVTHWAGIEQAYTVSPTDLKTLPPPVCINKPVNIYEVRNESLLDTILLQGHFAATSRYPSGIFIREGTVSSYEPNVLVEDIIMKEEFAHWSGGWSEYFSLAAGAAEAIAIYGPEYWYKMNPVERDRGLYGGRIVINDPTPDPWWNPYVSGLPGWWRDTTSAVSNWGENASSSVSNWFDYWWSLRQ